MGQARCEMKKTELLEKARELALLCDAEVALIIISSDGTTSKFASSDMERIIAKCWESGDLPEFEFKPEEPEEQVPEDDDDVLGEEEEMLKTKQLKVRDKDLSGLELDELNVLEKELKEGVLCIKDRKAQILIDQILESRMQEQQVLQENRMLQRQIEVLQGRLQSTRTDSNVGPADKFLPSTSFASPLATEKGPETECHVTAEVQRLLPSTSSAAPLAIESSPSLDGWLQKEKSSESETASSNAHT